MADGTITIGTELDTKEFDKQFKNLKGEYNSEAIQAFVDSFETAKDKAKRLKEEAKETNKQIKEISNNTKKLANNTEEAQKEAFNLGNSFQKSVKSVGRLALGIFGIRSAYMSLRRASSDLAGYDEQYATNLEYIRYALTQAIAPVLRGIVSLAMKLLQIIGMIVNALFGVNIFSEGSAENFQKMKAGANGVGKAVKEIKKQLLGFDEVNVLTDQSDTGTSAGAGGVGMPDLDLSKTLGEMPSWLKDIEPIIWGIVGAILALKLGLDGIKALGIGILIAGIVYTLQSLIAYLGDGSWENFGKIIQGIGIALAGLALIIGSVPVAVAGAITFIVGLIVSNWEKIKTFLQNGIDWLKGLTEIIRNMFGDGVVAIWEVFVSALQDILNAFDSFFTGVKKIFDGIIEFISGVFTGDWQKVWNGLQKIVTGVWDTIIGVLKYGLSAILKLAVAIASTVGAIIAGAFKGVVNAVLTAIETILNAPIKAINGLINVINAVPRN